MRRIVHFMTKPYTKFHTSPFVSSWSPAETVTQAIPHLLKKNNNKKTLLCLCAVSFEENMQTGLISAWHFSLIAEYQRACNQIWMENLSLPSSDILHLKRIIFHRITLLVPCCMTTQAALPPPTLQHTHIIPPAQATFHPSETLQITRQNYSKNLCKSTRIGQFFPLFAHQDWRMSLYIKTLHGVFSVSAPELNRPKIFKHDTLHEAWELGIKPVLNGEHESFIPEGFHKELIALNKK